MTTNELLSTATVERIPSEMEDYRDIIKCNTVATFGVNSYNVNLFASSVHYNEESAMILFSEQLQLVFVAKKHWTETFLWVEKII